jgi:hypothetical protein
MLAVVVYRLDNGGGIGANFFFEKRERSHYRPGADQRFVRSPSRKESARWRKKATIDLNR